MRVRIIVINSESEKSIRQEVKRTFSYSLDMEARLIKSGRLEHSINSHLKRPPESLPPLRTQVQVLVETQLQQEAHRREPQLVLDQSVNHILRKSHIG